MYILVHRNILMYILACHFIMYVILKTILAVTLFSIILLRVSIDSRWSLLQDCIPVKFKDSIFMKFSLE